MAKVGGAPLAAKLAALTLTVGAVGTAAGLETGARHRSPQRSHASARPAAARTHASTSSTLAAVPVAETVERSHGSHGRGEHEGTGRERETGDDNGGSQHGKAAPATETRESEPEHENRDDHGDRRLARRRHDRADGDRDLGRPRRRRPITAPAVAATTTTTAKARGGGS